MCCCTPSSATCWLSGWRLAADFCQRIADKELPDFVVDSLCRPWAQAVAQAQLAGVLEAADGAPITSVADDLIWCARFWIADSEVQHTGCVAVGSGPMPLELLELPSTELLASGWVDLLIEGEWVRAQLTWASPHGTLFMFVSAKGLAHSMTRRTLERLRGTDVLRVVSRGDVVEGALDAVVAQALRNAEASDTGV